MSRRIVLALDLVDDAELIAEYEQHHSAGAVWPGVVADIRGRGFRTMEIWRVADRLVMIADVADDFPRSADPALQPIVARWEAAMDRFQRRIGDGDDKWAAMTRIFTLDDQDAPPTA